MAELSEVLASVNRLLDDKMERENRDLNVALKMYELGLETERDVLRSNLQTVEQEKVLLQNEFDIKNEEYFDITGELLDLSTYKKTDSALVVLDQIKSPVLNVYEEQINDINADQAQLRNALKELTSRSSQITQVLDYYGGKTIDPKDKGLPGWDPKDFSKSALYTYLDVTEADAPEWLKLYVGKREGIQAGNIRDLNIALDTQILNSSQSKIRAYEAKNIDTGAFDAEVLISELTSDVAQILDSKVSGAVNTVLAGALSLADDYALTLTSYQTGQLDDKTVLENIAADLDTQKATIGNMFLLFPDAQPTVDGFQFQTTGQQNQAMALGGLILANFKIYNDSMVDQSGLRQIVPVLDVFEELGFISEGLDFELESLTNEFMVNGKLDTASMLKSDEYRKYSERLAAFEENLLGFSGWDRVTFTKFQEHFEGFSKVYEEQSLLKLNERLKLGLDLDDPIFDKPLPVTKVDYDYSGIIDLPKKAITSLYNFDSDGDNVPDSFDLDGDGIADTPSEAEAILSGTVPAKLPIIKAKKGSIYTPTVNTISTDDTHFDIETEGDLNYGMLRDETTGEVIRKIPYGNIKGDLDINVSDSKEILYYSNYSNQNTDVKNAKIDSLYASPSLFDNVLMQYITDAGEIDVQAVKDLFQSIEVGSINTQTQLSIAGINVSQQATDDLTIPGNTTAQNENFGEKFKKLTGGTFPAVEIGTKREYQLGARSVVAEPIYGARSVMHELEEWNIFRSLGGGGVLHDNSPWVDKYLELMMQDYNVQINNDDDIWFPSFHRGSKFKSWAGEWAGVLGFNQDIQILSFFESEYPEAFAAAQLINKPKADERQLIWLNNVLNLSGIESSEFEDRAEILKLLTLANNYNYK